ncbi:MAG: PAS domain-containing sensor histidine kinase [Melioribacteraceae bacterium]|nr:PAS domain-containing sensor histidine kinase [Melioribacteraceae bacterium]
METINNIIDNIAKHQTDSDSSEHIINSAKLANFMFVDETGLILYKSDSFCAEFDLVRDLKSIDELQTDPDISLIIKGMNYNKTDRLSLELLFYFVRQSEVKDYLVQINRITLLNKKFFLLLFEEPKIYKVFENKINTLQHALERGNIPVLIADEEYKTKYVTQNFEEILDKNIEDLYDKPIFDILISYLTESDETILLHAMETKKPWSKVISINHPKKENAFYDISITPEFDSSLRKWSYILSAYDITDYILKNRTLKKEEARLRGIINNIADSLFVIKIKNKLTNFEIGNDRFFETFHIDKNKFDASLFEKHFDVDLWNTVKQMIVQADQSKSKYSSYKFYYKKVDKYYDIGITYVDNKFDDERYYIITLRDITVKENYEKHLESAYAKERELNKLKTLILHNMSHELRTPANAMMGYTEIIEDAIESKDYDTVSQISISVKEILGKLINLFTNIIELSSIESGEYEVEIVRINCNQVLQSVFNKKFAEALSKNLNFSFESRDKNLFIKTDWVKFEKIIREIVDNAIKFTQEGSVKIESFLNEYHDAEIRIIDTGEGIEEENIKKILEPFQQEAEFYTRSYEGNGLGITISHKLTSLLGGKFKIESKKNKGTIVTLTFPTVSPRPTIELE